jgi:hypothetical protein
MRPLACLYYLTFQYIPLVVENPNEKMKKKEQWERLLQPHSSSFSAPYGAGGTGILKSLQSGFVLPNQNASFLESMLFSTQLWTSTSSPLAAALRLFFCSLLSP